MTKHVMIMAGGTGGHIFPGLAVADALQQHGAAVSWLGSAHGLENQIVPESGLPLFNIQVKALRGKGALGWLLAPLRISKAVLQARRVLRKAQPSCVLSMGGFAAGPGGLAARWLGIPLVVHEQNRRPGMTNRWLARWASVVCTGFAGAFDAAVKHLVTGNPVRAEIRALPEPTTRMAGRSDTLRVLILGGSLGARFLNTQVPSVLAQLAAQAPLEVLHQCGKRGVQEAQNAYREAGVSARVEAFIDDMAAVYGWADVVICRAGALTVSELMAAGVASILVPLPHAVDDHQYANGETLSQADAGLLVRQSQWNKQQIADTLTAWSQDRQQLQTMANAARRLHPGDAAAQVAELCLEVAR
jgi:UDP-N-acetylglucosamine--N-acetylmuramyl-(pentapeptide) pyrophosphoryl-undecaprenol N-acetylglucosamine transferase